MKRIFEFIDGNYNKDEAPTFFLKYRVNLKEIKKHCHRQSRKRRQSLKKTMLFPNLYFNNNFSKIVKHSIFRLNFNQNLLQTI